MNTRKRLLALLCAAAAGIPMGNLTVLSLTEPVCRGDCNLDGICSVADAVLLQKCLLGMGTLANAGYADMNEDFTINAFDLALLKKKLIEDEQETTIPAGMPLIRCMEDEVTPQERDALYDMLSRNYPDMDFSDFTFVHDPAHPLSDYYNGKLFSIFYKDILLHGYGNINCYDNVFAIVGKPDVINFVVDPILFTQVDVEQEIPSGWDVLPTCIDTEEPELIIYVDPLQENPPQLAYRAVSIDGYSEYILDAFTGELIEYIPYTVV